MPESPKKLNGNVVWKVAVTLGAAAIILFQIINFAQAQGDRSTAHLRRDLDALNENCGENDNAVEEIQRDVDTIKTDVKYIRRDIEEIKAATK